MTFSKPWIRMFMQRCSSSAGRAGCHSTRKFPWPTPSVTALRAAALPQHSLLQVQPHEAGSLLVHELRASVVDLVELCRRFCLSLLVGDCVSSRRRRLEFLLPVRVLLLEFRLGDPFGRRNNVD